MLFADVAPHFKTLSIHYRPDLALALKLFILEVPQSKLGLVKVKGQTVRLGFELKPHLKKQLQDFSHKTRGIIESFWNHISLNLLKVIKSLKIVFAEFNCTSYLSITAIWVFISQKYLPNKCYT